MSDPSDRRTFARIPIDVPIFCEIAFPGQSPIATLLKDISRGGVQVALSPGSTTEDMTLGQQAVVIGLPAKIGIDPGGVASIVSWLSPERVGLRFNDPLPVSEEELDAIIADA